MKFDYEKIGLRVGLECHQQLDTREKLFCACSPTLFRGTSDIMFLRRLRPTQSELGQIDPAAYFEFKKGVKILYEADDETSCLVEMDEEPPHELNCEALEIVLKLALMIEANPVDEEAVAYARSIPLSLIQRRVPPLSTNSVIAEHSAAVSSELS